jgi:hypothetical protein
LVGSIVKVGFSGVVFWFMGLPLTVKEFDPNEIGETHWFTGEEIQGMIQD